MNLNRKNIFPGWSEAADFFNDSLTLELQNSIFLRKKQKNVIE